MVPGRSAYPPTRLLVIGLGIVALAAGAALAQTNLETNAGIQFNFSTPGAANLAMGGAFLALADDATAAYTNPAGLTRIFYRELHLETRGFEYTHVYTDSGGLFDPENLPANFDPDAFTPDFDLLTNGEAANRTVGLSFLSYVHQHERWSWALYRHELARFEADFTTIGARIFPTRSRSPLGIPGERDGRLASLRNSMELVIVNYGAAAAHRVHPRLSLGAGISYYDFAIDSIAERRVPPLDVIDPAGISQSPVVNVQSQDGDNSDWGFNLGFLWEAAGGRWRVGGVYRGGPTFEFDARSEPPEDPPFDFPESIRTAPFHVPTVYGLGIAFLPSDAWRLTLDYDRVTYSDLTRGFVDIFGLENFFDDLTPEDVEVLLDGFVVDDADEIHFGFEHYFLNRTLPVAIRAGVWYDPDHSLRFAGDNRAFEAIFRRRGDELHYTFGAGVSHKSYQVHLAFDLSQRVNTGSLSLIYHF